MKYKKLLKFVSISSFAGLLPVVASAAVTPIGCYETYSQASPARFGDVINYASCTIAKSIVPLIFALAFTFFFWGVVQFVLNSDEEAKKAKGKQFMIWGIIALTVMFSVWGLIAILSNTFNIQSGVIPQFNIR